jgi:hypothetical protein
MASIAAAGSKKVNVALPVKPELQLDGTEKIFLGPFLLEPASDRSIEPVDITAVREFSRFLYRLLRRSTRLNVLPLEKDLRPPTDNPLELWKNTEFFKKIGEETGADYIVSASLDVEVLDRSGYTTEEYVSPEDGKTYYRQVLVEDTGFKFNILLMIFNGRTGELAYREQISTFKQRPERKLNQVTDLYSEVYNLESRLAGVFVPRMVPAKRYLYTN